MQKEAVSIVWVSSHVYLPLALMSMSSCLLAASDPSKLSLYLLGDQLTIEDEDLVTRTLIKVRAAPENIHILACHERLSQFKLTAETLSKGWPAAAFLRAFIPAIIPNSIKSILYVDVDTLWLCDACQLRPMLDTDAPLAWVMDNMNVWEKLNLELGKLSSRFFLSVKLPSVLASLQRWYKLNALPFIPDDYPNSGVLVMNLRRLRKDNLICQFSKFLERYQGMPTVDQDVFYSLYRTEATLLPQWMNFQWTIPSSPPRSCILHFAGALHPCRKDFNPHHIYASDSMFLLQFYWQRILRPLVGEERIRAWPIPVSYYLGPNVWLWIQSHFPCVFRLLNRNLIRRAKTSEAKRVKLEVKFYDVFVRYWLFSHNTPLS